MTRLLGLDVGDKTLGLAVSDALGITAQGLAVYRRSSLAADLAFIRRTLQDYEVTAIVVGLPRNMDGSIGPQAQKTLAFVEHLRQACALPVITWDERLTSREAERLLLMANASRRRRKEVRDRLAAQLILQSYLAWSARRSTAHDPETGNHTSLHESLPPEQDTAQPQDQQMRQPDAKC